MCKDNNDNNSQLSLGSTFIRRMLEPGATQVSINAPNMPMMSCHSTAQAFSHYQHSKLGFNRKSPIMIMIAGETRHDRATVPKAEIEDQPLASSFHSTSEPAYSHVVNSSSTRGIVLVQHRHLRSFSRHRHAHIPDLDCHAALVVMRGMLLTRPATARCGGAYTRPADFGMKLSSQSLYLRAWQYVVRHGIFDTAAKVRNMSTIDLWYLKTKCHAQLGVHCHRVRGHRSA